VEHLLPLVWIGIIAFGVVMYVILDGFTLGTAMVSYFMDEHERDLAVSVILPTWDGNQTWLVLGGATMYGAFPQAFAAILPALYMPLILMVIALLLRGVAFEFRLKATTSKPMWEHVFFASSLFATIIQGLIVGTFVQGFDINEATHQVSTNNFLSLFNLFTSLSLVFGYSLLGATRLILKTEGPMQDKMYRFAKYLSIYIIGAVGVVSIWTPFLRENIFERWFAGDHWLYLMVLPYITFLAFVILQWALYHRDDRVPFWSSVVLFLCSYVGFLISLFPFIVPYHIPFWEAAAPESTLRFILVGAVIMLPLLLIYTGYAYHIFSGKVKDVLRY